MSIIIFSFILLAVAYGLGAFLLGAFWRDMRIITEHRQMKRATPPNSEILT